VSVLGDAKHEFSHDKRVMSDVGGVTGASTVTQPTLQRRNNSANGVSGDLEEIRSVSKIITVITLIIRGHELFVRRGSG
jgi:hypothetical protein